MADRGALSRYRHIAVEGPIGVGKTTLAKRLAAQLDAELLLEKPNENPYLDRFYADMAGYAFQTQLAFLFQRARQMRALAQLGMFAPTVVSDFMFEKDRIFARLTLCDDEFALYRQMYEQVAVRLVPPDLIVWLQAPPTVLQERIRERAITMEQDIPLDYLQRLGDAYAVYFASDAGLRVPVLAVATEAFDPGRDAADFARLLARLATFGGGRELLEPGDLPFDL